MVLGFVESNPGWKKVGIKYEDTLNQVKVIFLLKPT